MDAAHDTAELIIREADAADAGAAALIDSPNYASWTPHRFDKFQRRRTAVVYVAEIDHAPLGWIAARLSAGGIILTRCAVHRNARRAGIGRRLADRLKERSHRHRPAILADVRGDSHHLGAHLWLRACGFSAIALRASTNSNADEIYTFAWQRFPPGRLARFS